jgi:arylsulfatase A-like enzyme
MDPRLPAARRGVTASQLVQSIDVAPTMLDVAGLAVPASMQGRSLQPLLGGKRTRWREYAFAENLWSTAFGNPRVESIRSSRWKYIRYFATDRKLFDKVEGEAAYRVASAHAAAYESWLTASVRGLKPDYEELFDLSADPDEAVNLASQPAHAPLLSQLRAECDRQVRGAKGTLDSKPLTLPLPAGEAPSAAD